MKDFTGWKFYKGMDGVANIGIVIVHPNGGSESRLISDSDVIAWIASGGAPLPADAAIPSPNRALFITAMTTALGGILAANNYAKAYPLFMPAFDAADWVNASAIIQNALATLVVTPTQYAAIKAAAVTYSIPLTLP